MKPWMPLTACAVASGLCGPLLADEAPAPAPAAEAIKACIRQIDIGNKWRFEWKHLEIGAPRHPRNSYEALYAPPGPAWSKSFGYPVHVAFNVDGRADIDAVYWLIRDAGGHWQIPAICTIP